ncbi:(2,3-dihydroxybenzoyl)adenylate synthase [Motilimonas cestriensis]|uniref:(2,3-dihydroxybenzoyl)adenylate synthase n=1 Tax=Motilimonas cestriensis TaxID=2742685 RepID=A0ABS8WF97_9GAMM|nr:(2,3-dihydroxybenzoyl)adenylate synthase [Motilimonas cestriensis]MCE2597002.1 (2,3-dihydroxybenzoyl)adenylate synthase [Motilimonas cestriensis]
MSIPFTPWPEPLAKRYREKGYWSGQPLVDIITRHQATAADDLALICGERCYRYADLDRLSSHLASHLHQIGLRAGATALVQLPNIAEFYLVYFALLKVGIAPVNALFSHNKVELMSYVEQLQPEVAIVSSQHALFKDNAFAQQLRAICPVLDHWLLEGEASWAHSLSALFDSPAANVSATDWQSTSPDQVAFFQLSGGSTGTPKLIPRTHDDYYYSVRASAEICQINTDTRYLCALPAAHNFSLSSPGSLGVFYAGGTVVLATDPSAMTCFPLIHKHGITVTALVPPAITLWLQAASSFPDYLTTLSVVQVGGARLSEALAKRIKPELGCQLQQVFGMAEGLVNYTRLDDDEWHTFHTQGRPISEDDEIKIVNQAGERVPTGEAGALLTRGPYTFRGYYLSPEHNETAFDQEGFYRSGDVVKQTESGYLIVVGRDKDQINRGGEKIAAEEIENQLLTHPSITNVAIVSMPDPIMGEKSCAFVTREDETLTAMALRKYLRSLGVAAYKLPDHVEFIDRLPETPVGKIDKRQLRQLIQQIKFKQVKES